MEDCAIMPTKSTTLIIERFSASQIGLSEKLVVLKSARAFAKAEFGFEGGVIREEKETIPNTRAPYHVQPRLKADVSKRARQLAA